MTIRRDTGEARLSVPSGACKVCAQPFMKLNSMQIVCGIKCAKAYPKHERKAHKAKLEAIKPRSQHLREAQAAFNAWVRARDAHLPCISCGRFHQGSHDAGHYLSTGARPELRFDPANVHRQCVPCNQHLHGNIALYRVGLISRIGLAAVERLEGPHEPVKLDIPALQALKADYRARTRALLAKPEPTPAVPTMGKRRKSESYVESPI